MNHLFLSCDLQLSARQLPLIVVVWVPDCELRQLSDEFRPDCPGKILEVSYAVYKLVGPRNDPFVVVVREVCLFVRYHRAVNGHSQLFRAPTRVVE